MRKYFFSLFLMFNFCSAVQAQQSICDIIANLPDYNWDFCLNIPSTTVPLLITNDDAVSGGMGEVGIALSSNTNSIFFNSAKMVFNEKEGVASFTYRPWLRNLGVKDMYLTNLTMFHKIGQNQAVGGSVRYSSLGELNYTGFFETNRIKPWELYINIGYSVKLTERFSAGLTAKYIHSNLLTGFVIGGGELVAGKAIAADLSVFYTQALSIADMDGNFNAGLSISNIGNKISYFDDKSDKDFLPTNLGIGAAYDLHFENGSKITLAYDINKLLTPTPKADQSHLDKSVIAGIFTSFADVPFTEELAEIKHSLGLESYIKLFKDSFGIVRTGFFNEHQTKGNRKYFTLGTGFKCKSFEIALSRIFDNANSPLQNTYKITLQNYL